MAELDCPSVNLGVKTGYVLAEGKDQNPQQANEKAVDNGKELADRIASSRLKDYVCLNECERWYRVRIEERYRDSYSYTENNATITVVIIAFQWYLDVKCEGPV